MSEWISVEDRLPREYVDTVLVARSTAERVPVVMPAYYAGGKFLSVSVAGAVWFKSPTHWMPLPEPPK